MPPTADPQHLAVLLWATLAAVGLLLAVLAWVLRQSLAGLGRKLDGIELGVQRLASTVGNHGESLAKGAAEFDYLRGAVRGLEDRERQRACFGACRLTRHGESET
jgi:hypothetical protein